jgi:hypothetical protein
MDYIAEALRITNQKRIADGLPPLKHFGAGEDGYHHDYVEPVRVRNSYTPLFPDSPPAPKEHTCFPDEIRIWPQVILSAAQQTLGGAIRIWTLAKALDHSSGSGVIDKSLLMRYLEWLDVPIASRYRWLRSATQTGILHPVRGGSRFLIRGIHRVGELINCEDIGYRCTISAKALTHTHWKSSVWDLVLTQFKNRPVSRTTLFVVTGIPVRTQVELERYGLVHVQRNWCITNTHPRLITPYQEFTRPHAFVARMNKHPHIVYQLPNNYTVPKLSGSSDGGNFRRKTYAAASASVKSDNPETCFSVVRFPESNFQEGGARCEKIHRRYFDREKPFTRTLRRLGRLGISSTLYQKTRTAIRKPKSGWYLEEQI